MFVLMSGRRSAKSTAETLEDVLHRIAILERTVLKLSKSGHLDESIRPPSPRATEKSRIRSAYGPTSTDEDVAMMLEVITLFLFQRFTHFYRILPWVIE